MQGHEISLQAGRLQLQLTRGADRLNELLGFASRQNPKRGYLFVSKVLGKHIPVRPSKMRTLYSELASQLLGKFAGLKDSATTLVVGMSETATGLGAGVADELARLAPAAEVIYQHTTRHQLPQPLWLEVDESHSHAVDHLLYRLPAELLADPASVTRLVLVDDEISTGRTLGVLLERLAQQLPRLQEVALVTIAAWLSDQEAQALQPGALPLHLVSLLQGTFEFTPHADFSTELPQGVDGDLQRGGSRTDLGRLGLRMPAQLNLDAEFAQLLASLPAAEQSLPLAVIGVGEHLFEPFLFAEWLEQRGYDVVFQSSTRSPVLPGGAIRRRLVFPVRQGAALNFCYNLDPHRQPLICEEFADSDQIRSALLKALHAETRRTAEEVEAV